MKMQKSLVSVNEGMSQLHLSGLLSEWLFSSGFWSDFNVKHGTMFDQFEEDEANVPIVEAIIEALSKRVCDLEKEDKSNVEFVYRWTFEQKPVTTNVPRVLLLSELSTLRDFLVNAVAKNHCVTFTL